MIGTGASAIQIVPAIAGQAGQLTSSSARRRGSCPGRPRHPALERALFRRVPARQRLVRGRHLLAARALALGFVTQPRHAALASSPAASAAHREQVPRLRAKLDADYTMGCKRILPLQRLLPALQRPNVELVTDGSREVTRRGRSSPPTGASASRRAHPRHRLPRRRRRLPPFVRGRGGRASTRSGTGAEAYLGTAVAGFPNLFLCSAPTPGSATARWCT